MSDEIENYQPTFVRMPDFNQVMAQRLNQIPPPSSPSSGFDPHKVLVQKKEAESNPDINPQPKISHREKDIKTLEDFCKQHGIVGFNCGMMSPIAALAMLKAKLGVVDSLPLEQRYGIENKKSLLKG